MQTDPRVVDAIAAQMSFDINEALRLAEEEIFKKSHEEMGYTSYLTPEQHWAACGENTRDLWRKRANNVLKAVQKVTGETS